MAVPAGLKGTYELNVGTKLDFEDTIYLLSPFDVPLLGTTTADGLSTLAKGPATQKKVEWQDEELLNQRSAVVAPALTSTSTQIVVTTGDGPKFGIGDIVVVDAEAFRVTAVATDTLTVAAYDGTRAAHAVGAAVVGVGQALPEGSDPEEARAIDRVNRTNFTEIFGPWAVITSGTEDAIDKYGLVGNEHDHQVGNRLKEMAVSCEQAILYGIKKEDTANRRRTMGGFTTFITNNVDSTTTTLTETLLLDQLQAAFDDGGSPDRIITGGKQKRLISGFGATNIRYDQGEMTRGQIVDWYDSDFGRQYIVLDRWVRNSDLFIINRDQAEVGTLRPMQYETLAKTGDSTKGQVLCEKTLRFHKDRHAARFSALT